MSRRSTAIEGALVIGLLALGFFVGSFASRHYALQPSFYQDKFGPALMVAAGRGFVNPVAEPGSPVAEFLALRRSSLDRADLVKVSTTGSLDQFQLGSRYLMLAVGYCWNGDFVAIVDIPDSGTYVPTVTNATARDRDRNRFVLSRFGIVEANHEQP